jgi:hypothetical protein
MPLGRPRSIDGGTLRFTDDDNRAGWRTSDTGKVFWRGSSGDREVREDWRIAYSPKILSIRGLPNETHDECCAGFDEWYVFAGEVPAGDMEAFVNWVGLRVYDPQFSRLVERLWKQLERLSCETYIAHGTVLTSATRNAELFGTVIAAARLQRGMTKL